MSKWKKKPWNMAQGEEDIQLDFELTWGVGVPRTENFVLFRYFKPEDKELAVEVPDKVYDPFNPLLVSVDQSLEKYLSMESLFEDNRHPCNNFYESFERKFRCRAMLVIFKVICS